MLLIWLQVDFNLMVGNMTWLMRKYPQVEENIQGVGKSWMQWIFRAAKGTIILVFAHVKSWGKAWCYVSLVLTVLCISDSQSVFGRAAALASLKTYEDADYWCREPKVGSQWSILTIISTLPWCIERKIWSSLCYIVLLYWYTMAVTCRKFLFGGGWWNTWHEILKELLE